MIGTRAQAEGLRRKSIAISRNVGRVIVDITFQRNMHASHDELVFGSLLQDILHEGELPRPKLSDVFAAAIGRAARIRSQIGDVVEHEEENIAMMEGVVGRAENPFEGFAGIGAVLGLEVQIVIAADVPPRKPDLPDDAIVAAIHRKIVEQDVAGRNSEGGLRTDKGVHDIVADKIELDMAFRLRIGEEKHIERCLFRLPR